MASIVAHPPTVHLKVFPWLDALDQVVSGMKFYVATL
jgi:hypothetical protein